MFKQSIDLGVQCTTSVFPEFWDDNRKLVPGSSSIRAVVFQVRPCKNMEIARQNAVRSADRRQRAATAHRFAFADTFKLLKGNTIKWFISLSSIRYYNLVARQMQEPVRPDESHRPAILGDHGMQTSRYCRGWDTMIKLPPFEPDAH